MLRRNNSSRILPKWLRKPLAFDTLEDRVNPVAIITATLVDSLIDNFTGGAATGTFNQGDGIRYDVVITNSGDAAATSVVYSDAKIDALTTLLDPSVKISPLAVRQTYTSAGNTPLTVAVGTGLKTNVHDLDPVGKTPDASLVVTAGTFATSQGGSVTINADGSFTYTPQTGKQNLVDTFTYNVVDTDGLAGTGTVAVTVGERVWYVDSAAAAGGDGSFGKPFQTLTPLNVTATDVDDASDTIFVYNRGVNYTTGIALEASQILYGDGFAFTANGLAIGVSASNSTILNGAGNAITLAEGNTIDGLSLGATSGAGVIGSAVNVVTLGSGFSFGTGVAGNDFDLTGGNGTFTVTQAFSNSAGRSISIASRTGGTITFLGTVSETGQGISLTGNTGATINFTNALTLSTGANAALSVTGGTVNVSGGLTITTTSGAGFTATGGTVNVTGTTNTISTGTGTALNIVNATIGSNSLTFSKISANGAASGIILNNTGTSGGLKVTGDGTGVMNGSGGTINNTTSFGISLTSTRNVSLTQLNVSNTAGHGINVSSVTNFTYQDASLINAADGNDEQAINLLNTFGTSLIEDVRLDDIQEDGIQIRQNIDPDSNNTTFDTLTIRRLSVEDHQAGFGETGIEAQVDQSSSLAVVVDASTFTLNTNAVIGCAMSSAASFTTTGRFKFTVQNSKFICTNAFGSGSIQALGGGAGTTTYLVTGNTITNTKFDGIRINNDGGHTNATITNNDIDGSANNNGEGVTCRQDENGTMLILISGNDMTEIKSNQIHIQGSDATVDDAIINVDATITNNTGVCAGTFGAGIYIDVGDGSNIAKNDVRLNISGNNLDGTETAEFFDFDITLQLNETSGASLKITQASNAALTTANNAMSVSSFANPPNTIQYNAGTPPLPPLPLLAAIGGVDSFSPVSDTRASGHSTVDAIQPDAIAPSLTERLSGVFNDGTINDSQLQLIVGAAIQRWETAGLSAEQIEMLRSTRVTTADMPGWYLGSASPGNIEIDTDAAGYGWFHDSTPFDDGEFSIRNTGTRLYADSMGSAAGRLDLLSTVMHELGHQLGLEDSYDFADRDSLMFGYLTLGERRLPAIGQADGAMPHDDHDHADFLFTPLNIGTLDHGSTVRITYVTNVNDPLAHNVTQVSNQGQVDFATAQVKLTDDPAVGGASDPTLTPILVINRVPVVANAIPDQIFTGAGAKSFAFATNTFSDKDADPLTYTSKLSGGGALPTWLTFTPGTGTFAGNPASTDTTPLSIRVTADDGFGGSVFDDFQLTLTTVNDAPVLTVATPSLPAINTLNTTSPGALITALVGARITDGDAGALQGIAIQSMTIGSGGNWQYALDGTTFVNFPAISSIAPLLLNADVNTRVRFVPTVNGSGTPSITYRAWDRTAGGVEGAVSSVDPAGGGGTSAFSSAFESAGIAVTAIPNVTAITVNSGAAQRSRLTRIDMTFAAAVTAAEFTGLGTIKLTRTAATGTGTVGTIVQTGATGANGLITVAQNGMNGVTLTFSNANAAAITAGVESGSLADGRWQLAMAINGYTSPLNDPTLRRLFGDGNNDGTIDGNDLAALGAAFGTTGSNLAFDFDNNGTVDAADYGQFGNRFGMTL